MYIQYTVQYYYINQFRPTPHQLYTHLLVVRITVYIMQIVSYETPVSRSKIVSDLLRLYGS